MPLYLLTYLLTLGYGTKAAFSKSIWLIPWGVFTLFLIMTTMMVLYKARELVEHYWTRFCLAPLSRESQARSRRQWVGFRNVNVAPQFYFLQCPPAVFFTSSNIFPSHIFLVCPFSSGQRFSQAWGRPNVLILSSSSVSLDWFSTQQNIDSFKQSECTGSSR